MSAIDEILGQLPIDQIAAQVGASPDEVTHAVQTVLPALLGGMGANASNPAGAASLAEALGQHDNDLLTGGVDLAQVDTAQGEAISGHVFGTNQDAVISQLGGVGGAGEGLVRKLLPILAPIVLSWLAKQVMGSLGGRSSGGSASPAPSPSTQSSGSSLPQRQDSGGAAAPGGSDAGIQDILNQVLQGATKGAGGASAGGSAGRSSAPSAGSVITDILGGLLGGGRR